MAEERRHGRRKVGGVRTDRGRERERERKRNVREKEVEENKVIPSRELSWKVTFKFRKC